MKRIITAMLAAVMVLSMFAGCSGSTGTAPAAPAAEEDHIAKGKAAENEAAAPETSVKIENIQETGKKKSMIYLGAMIFEFLVIVVLVIMLFLKK